MKDKDYNALPKGIDVCPIWHEAGSSQMGKLVEQCGFGTKALDRITSKHHPTAIKAGFAAEALHAETFNLDAILKDSKVRAYTDKCQNTPLKVNDPVVDVLIMSDGKVVESAQLKYYQTPEKTANAFRKTREGIPAYKDATQHLAPADQWEQVKAHAKQTEHKNSITRPEVADAARDVHDKVTDRLRHDGLESTPLAKKDIEVIAKGGDTGKGAHRKIQAAAKNTSTYQQTLTAAKSAAMVSAILSGTINTVSCLNKVQRGEMSTSDAVKYIIKNTAIAAGDSAIKASAATAVTSLTTRAFPELFQASALQASFVGATVAGASICAVDLIQCLVLVAAGKMTMQELETRTGKNIFQTSSGSVGAAIGVAVGAPAGPPGMLVGSLIGGMIISVATTMAIENKIEKPFQETILITSNLVSTGYVMTDAIDYLHHSRIYFGEFEAGLVLSEQQFAQQEAVIDQLGLLLTEKIKRI